jgi:hypothetical protein
MPATPPKVVYVCIWPDAARGLLELLGVFVALCSFRGADQVPQKTPFDHEGGVGHRGSVTVMFY